MINHFVLPLFQGRPIQRPAAVIQLIVPPNRRSKHVLEVCLSCFENSDLLHLLSAQALDKMFEEEVWRVPPIGYHHGRMGCQEW